MPEITLRNASDPKFWKPLALSSMLMIAQQFSGNLAVVFNTVSTSTVRKYYYVTLLLY